MTLHQLCPRLSRAYRAECKRLEAEREAAANLQRNYWLQLHAIANKMQDPPDLRRQPESVKGFKPCPYCHTLLNSSEPACECGAIQRTLVAFADRSGSVLSAMRPVDDRCLPVANPCPSRDEWEAMKKILRKP